MPCDRLCARCDLSNHREAWRFVIRAVRTLSRLKLCTACRQQVDPSRAGPQLPRLLHHKGPCDWAIPYECNGSMQWQTAPHASTCEAGRPALSWAASSSRAASAAPWSSGWSSVFPTYLWWVSRQPPGSCCPSTPSWPAVGTTRWPSQSSSAAWASVSPLRGDLYLPLGPAGALLFPASARAGCKA